MTMSWTRLFFAVFEREREREKKAVSRRDKERHCWVHQNHPGKGKEGDLSERSKRPLCIKRTSHLKGVVVLVVRPHPSREEEEKIVVAVLRATRRSMMMMTVLFRRRTTTTTHDDDDAHEWRTHKDGNVEGSPPPTFLF